VTPAARATRIAVTAFGVNQCRWNLLNIAGEPLGE
jgi:hypothetical protein